MIGSKVSNDDKEMRMSQRQAQYQKSCIKLTEKDQAIMPRTFVYVPLMNKVI